MSRYAVDKLIREVMQRPDAHAAFAADPQAYTAGRDLTDAERAALVTHDFTWLYTLGAHPFLLVGFVGRMAEAGRAPARIEEYQRSLADLGYPDYST